MRTIDTLCAVIALMCITACKKPVNTIPVTQTDSTKTNPPDIHKPVVKPDSIVTVVYSGMLTHSALDHPNTFHKTYTTNITVTCNYTDSVIAFQGDGDVSEILLGSFKVNAEHQYFYHSKGRDIQFRLVADSLYAANGKTTGMGGEWYEFKGTK
jgi:hypothetical protein